MIQRIQTLLLLGAIICLALVITFPLWEKSDVKEGKKIVMTSLYLQEYEAENPDVWTLKNEQNVMYIAGACGVISLLILFSIFSYKNRLLQIKLGALNAFLMMLLIAASAYIIYKNEMELIADSKGIFLPGFYLLLGALILNSLANRFIRKDEKLVRSVDRIR